MFGVDEGDQAQWYLSAEWAEEGWAEEEECEVGWASGWVKAPGAKWLVDFPFGSSLVS